MNNPPTSSLLRCQGKLKSMLFGIYLLTVLFIGYQSNTYYRKINITVPVTDRITLPPPLYPYLIEERTKCMRAPPFLLLLIPSPPQDSSVRDALRKTWANESLVAGISTMRLFLLGRTLDKSAQEKVERESEIHHDIVQQDFVDSYGNLTLKTLMGFEWVYRLCPNVSYVMKVDSDMFLNPWFLVRRILEPEKPVKVRFFTGLVLVGSTPFRDKQSKWYIPPSVYPKNYYPPYCSGTGYVFSGDIAASVYKSIRTVPIFPLEDVFVGMCLEASGIKISRTSGNLFTLERLDYNRCKFARMVTVHHYKPNDLLSLWPDFVDAVKSCS
ncbi:beta-1,3-galactosyltransferase 5-like [Spea bombifrons]|uniref:beta-1,3-galactosyltransferase 5-like n=1 Tax=Spea bombifrons TaxID=233779 RepID=UPI00234B2D36|nr:beta-1,3-galactosyltransferase 5-like [Spea bombifrons]